MKKLRFASFGLLIAMLFASCASEAAKAQAKKEREEKDKYVDYYPTGSNVPIKILKEDAQTSQTQTDQTQDVLRSFQRSGSHPETGPQSGVAGVASPSSK